MKWIKASVNHDIMVSMTETVNAVTVSAPSRLHFGLHDCGYATPRLFGGVGVMVDGFETVVEARLSDTSSANFECDSPGTQTIEAVNGLVGRIESSVGSVAVNVLSMAPEHSGLGSKTSLLLAISAASKLVRQPDLRSADIKEEVSLITERGGTSGVGINGFWTGGLIVDGGHAAGNSRNFEPSSRRKPDRIPPVITNIPMPQHWKVQLFEDPDSHKYSGRSEVDLFGKVMPIDRSEILDSMNVTFHGILPATIEEDLEAFAIAIRKFNEVGMKAYEIQHQTSRTNRLLQSLWKHEMAAGLSSVGPTVYCVVDTASAKSSPDPTVIASDIGANFVGEFGFNNSGYQLQCIR